MKNRLIAISTAMCSLLSTAAAHAQDQGAQGGPGMQGGGPGMQGGGHGGFRERMLERFDTNHDGVLDDNEKAKMREFMEQRRAARQNGAAGGPGGAGTAGGAGHGMMGGPGSGMGGPGGQGGHGGPDREQFRQRMLQRFDANHDGVLDDAEKAKMREFMQQRHNMRHGGGDMNGPGGGGQQGPGPGGPPHGAPGNGS